MDDVDKLHPQNKELYCEEHDLFHVKNAMGTFVCPFCRADIDI